MQNLLAELNDQQLESVITTDVPLRIIAGAGSGKTRVITAKIIYLIEQIKINPYKILAVTFTNKAAKEMKERVLKLTDDIKIPYIMTFHSFCVRILREDFSYANLSSKFTIIDTDDQTQIIKKILEDLNYYEEKLKQTKKIIREISRWKSNFTSPDEAYENEFNIENKKYAKVFNEYQNYLKENDMVDFNDLILKVHKLLNENKDIREKWKNRFDYIMVDEFQDTNYTQFDLIKLLTGERGCLTVVGDPDQTIYSWRGAIVDNILNFNKSFKNTKTIMLTQNYRSTQNILDLANRFIDNNKNREKKDIFTLNNIGNLTQIKEAASRNFEAKYVAQEIEKLIKEKNYKYSDFFILYRTNAWSLEFEKEFANNKIPFHLIGSFRFRDRKIIKDITALLKIVAVQDDFSFMRVFSFIPKVGAVTTQKLLTCAQTHNINLFELLTTREDLVNEISKNLTWFCEMLRDAHKKHLSKEPIVNIAKFLVENSGLKNKLNLKEKEDLETMDNINNYYDQMQKFDDDYEKEDQSIPRTNKFLQDESILASDNDEFEVPNKTTLLTMHAAKGLENKVVFIVGLNQDVFPSRFSLSSISALEDERRVLYVAITRAQELLYISYVAGERSYISNGELGPSRFISELDPKLYAIEKNIFFHSSTEMTSQKFSSGEIEKKPDKLDAKVVNGDIINHVFFGEGIVERILDKHITVAFKNNAYGIKSLSINDSAWKKK